MTGGAVLPVVNTSIGNVPDHRVRARLFAGASIATLLGLLAGPAASGFVLRRHGAHGDVSEMTPAVVGMPLTIAAVCALVVAMGVALGGSETLPRPVRIETARTPIVWRQASPVLFASFLVLFGLGAFEAMLPVLAPTALSLDPPALGALLALCMVVMLAVKRLVPRPDSASGGARPFLAAGFLVLAAGIAFLGQAGSLAGAALAVALIGAGGPFCNRRLPISRP